MLFPAIRKETQSLTRKKHASHQRSAVTAQGTGGSAAASAAEAVTFSSTLQTQQNTPAAAVHETPPHFDKTQVSALIGKLEAQGEALIINPSLPAYARYQSALQTLLEVTLPNAYNIVKLYSKVNDDAALQTQKEYQLITVATEELASLLQLIKETHQDKIAIVAKVFDIKGMIINFLR